MFILDFIMFSLGFFFVLFILNKFGPAPVKDWSFGYFVWIAGSYTFGWFLPHIVRWMGS